MFRDAFNLHQRILVEKFYDRGFEIGCVRAGYDGLSGCRRFKDALSAMRDQAAADKNNLG